MFEKTTQATFYPGIFMAVMGNKIGCGIDITGFELYNGLYGLALIKTKAGLTQQKTWIHNGKVPNYNGKAWISRHRKSKDSKIN